MYNSIGIYDWQTVLSLIESIALVLVVGIGLKLLIRLKPVTKQNRQIIMLLFAAWAIASVSLACIRTYSYFENQRNLYIQSIESQKQQNGL